MYRCLFCGYDNSSEKVSFCVECGPDGAAKDWTQEDIDQSANVRQYVSMISELYFDEQTSAAVEKFSLRMRERFKISHDTHVGAIAKLAAQKKAIAHLANFRIEFNENVTDAYAGHDTYLSFRYTNLSEDNLFKISLLWDAPETTDRIDLRAQTSSFVKPQGVATLAGSVIFDRMGIKELADMQITIADQFGESANFKAEPFSFKVGNHDQRITQNISTHNQISIEGRGVVDASGMGTEKTSAQSTTNNQPRWRELNFSYVPTAKKAEENEPVTQAKVAAPKPIQQKVDIVDLVKTTHIKSNKNDLLSLQNAAEQGNADAQLALGHWYRKANAPTQPPTDGHSAGDYGNYSYNDLLKIGKYYRPNGTTEVGTFENSVFQEPHVKTVDADQDGHLSWNDGSSFVGRVEDGKPEGFGTMTFANGDSMYGMFVNGNMNDETGHHDFADGGTYDGPMVGGTRFNGLGTRIFGGDYVGHSYTGNFENGNFNGEGTYTFPDGSTNVGLFKDGKFVPPSLDVPESNSHKGSSFTVNNLSAKDIILYYATKKIGSLGRHFYINNGYKFTKKINNFSISFSKSHSKKFNPTADTPLLFYDGTILGSGKDGIVFTDKYIFAKGCLERSVRHIDILYSQIINVRLTDDKIRSKEIYIESSGHAELIVINPIYIEIEDILLIVQMLNEIIGKINKS